MSAIQRILLALGVLLTVGVNAGTPVSITIPEDPYYFDICLQVTGELCEFCCLTD